MFEYLQIIMHQRGGLYQIKKIPDDRRLEHNNEPFYEYESMDDGKVWLRSQSEMEDGRYASISLTGTI